MTGSEIIIYTDGACETNPGPGGWAAILTWGAHRKLLSGGSRHTTNNRMELRAVIEALKALKKEGRRVMVVTDSQYVSRAVNERWIEKWAAKGFRKADGFRDNTDLWVELRTLLARHTVQFEWIRGHAGHEDNEACDVMAVAARRQKDLAPDEGFENPEGIRAALGLTLLLNSAALARAFGRYLANHANGRNHVAQASDAANVGGVVLIEICEVP